MWDVSIKQKYNVLALKLNRKWVKVIVRIKKQYFPFSRLAPLKEQQIGFKQLGCYGLIVIIEHDMMMAVNLCYSIVP